MTIEKRISAAINLPNEPITQPGDLWFLGGHRLLCGDAGKPEDVDLLLSVDPAKTMELPAGSKIKPKWVPIHSVVDPLGWLCGTREKPEVEHMLDLFGNNSTLVEAERVGGRAFLMGLSPRHCDEIIRRWEESAGLKAERIPA
jgi:hypothetical protein